MPDTVLEPPPHTVPAVFTRALLDWLPWLEPLMVEALTERHVASLVDAARVNPPYFRLLARDRSFLGEYPNRQGHLLQPGRRLAAGGARASPPRNLSVQRVHLLRLGACAAPVDLFEARGGRAAAARRRRQRRSRRALERHRRRVGGADRDADHVRSEHVERLRRAGLEDLAIADVIHAAAFFNWANRLMLSLGEPTPAAGT